MPKKILLISAASEEPYGDGRVKKPSVKIDDQSHYPLGIAYLHSYLEAQGHEVKTLFLCSYNHEESEAIVKETLGHWLPDVVGFQVLADNRLSTYKFIDFFHEVYPSIKLLAGGIHASIMYKQLITKFPYLIIVRGEGELTFAELSTKIFAEKPQLEEIDGIAFWKDGEILATRPRALIEDLDSLPWPKHEIFFNDKRTLGNLLTTRGCPFNCSFCCLDTISRRRVRYRSVKNVVDEIEYMINKFPQLSRIWIHDDTFFINNQRAIDFCDEVIKRKINIKFVCSGRFKPLSELLIKKLEEANFVHICLGLESGNQQILNKAHKGIMRQDVINAFELFAKSKINIFPFLVVGLPGETETTIADTGLFVQELQRIKYVHYMEGIAILMVYPGAEIYEIAKEAGIINDNYWLKDKPTPFFLAEHSQAELFAFKELLLDYICCDRIFRPRAFRLQWRMIPYIIGDKTVRDDFMLNSLKKIHLLSFARFLVIRLRVLRKKLKKH